MRDEEFNHVNITNEKEGFSNFEFGYTQKEETASFSDNKNNIRDEVNDNPSKNSENNKREEKKRKEEKENEDRLRDQLSKSDSSGNGSSSSGSASSSSSGAVTGTSAVATVVGASVVAVTTISALVGINLYINAKVKMNQLSVTAVTLDYDLDLTDTNNDEFIITIENKVNNYYSYKDLVEGNNVGEFTDLTPDTVYTLSVVDSSSENFVIDTREVKTSSYEPGPTPPVPGQVTLSFDSDGRGGTMSSFEVDANKAYTLPVSIFVPRDDEYFAGWKINGEGEVLQPGQTVSLKANTTLLAVWNKFPTREHVVTANRYFFENFLPPARQEIQSKRIMSVDFQYQYTAFDDASGGLQLTSDGGFVSTSIPFGGVISKISVTTHNDQGGVVKYTIAYSDYPIYEKVTVGGETQSLDSSEFYTFNCTNPDARYFCLSNEKGNTDALINTMEFTYLIPVIDNSFQVYFDANGGKGTFGPYEVEDKNRDYLPDIEDVGFEAPDGYEFSGWKVKGVNDLLESGTLIGISSDITLVAQWKPAGPTTNYTIRFDSNGGGFGSLSNIEAAPGEVVNLPDRYDLTNVVYPSNYFAYFAGWSEEPDGLDPVDYSYTVTGDTTLYAIWGYGYELCDDFGEFKSCDQDPEVETEIDGKGTFIYQTCQVVSNMFFMNYGDCSYFSNAATGTEEPLPIESVVVVFGGGPIAVSVTFSESSLNQYNYVSEGAHEYNPPVGERESHEFTAPSDVNCSYFNISADFTASTVIVSNIIVKYRQ